MEYYSIMQRNWLSFALAFFAAVITAMQTPTFASEQFVVLSLFKAAEPCQQFFLQGPVLIKNSGIPGGGSSARIEAGFYKLSYQSGSFMLTARDHVASPIPAIKNTRIFLQPVARTIAIGPSFEKMRHYRGSLEILMDGKSLVCKNKVALKDYVHSVVGSESRIEFPKEALKALSVLVQTSMLKYHQGDDLNDSTEKQAYLGADYERALIRSAVDETWGQTLVCQSRPVPVYFHSCCAGKTSKSDLFSAKASGLACDKSVDCHFCKDSAFWKKTTTEMSKASYLRKFPEGLVLIKAKDTAERPAEVQYANSSRKETGYQYWLKFGQRFGWGKMPGTRFAITDLHNGKIQVSSSGAGHGVGLCQWGAAGMAKAGANYKKILQYYFPGSSLQVPGNKS